MELNCIIAIIDRDRRRMMESLLKEQKLFFSLTMLASGTATTEHLSLYGLTVKEKAIIWTVADAAQGKALMRAAKEKMYIDIPGNGIMFSIPIKSVGGTQSMAQLTDQKPVPTPKPGPDFPYELVLTIVQEGYSEEVMMLARAEGATGGTVLAAKGSGRKQAEKFLGLSLADEKDVLMILVRADRKADVMRAIMEKSGVDGMPQWICFSLPVSHVAGLRRIED